jgi:hypothetical protein
MHRWLFVIFFVVFVFLEIFAIARVSREIVGSRLTERMGRRKRERRERGVRSCISTCARVGGRFLSRGWACARVLKYKI